MHPLKACILGQGKEVFTEKIPSFVFSCGIILSTSYCLCPMLSVVFPFFSCTAAMGSVYMALPCQPGSAHVLLFPMHSILMVN